MDESRPQRIKAITNKCIGGIFVLKMFKCSHYCFPFMRSIFPFRPWTDRFLGTVCGGAAVADAIDPTLDDETFGRFWNLQHLGCRRSHSGPDLGTLMRM